MCGCYKRSKHFTDARFVEVFTFLTGVRQCASNAMQHMVWKAKLCVQSCQQTLVRGGVGLVLEPCMELHVLDDSLESGHSLLCAYKATAVGIVQGKGKKLC
jgi:hypothetical protein